MNKELQSHLTLFIGFILLSLSNAEAAPMICHLHAPSDYHPFGKIPLVIPAVGDSTDCDNLNQERFGGRGLCHCSFDSSGIGSSRFSGSSDYNGRKLMPLP